MVATHIASAITSNITSSIVGADAVSPADLNLIEWYDSSDTSTITIGTGGVSSMTDKSGNGHTITQGASTRRFSSGTRTQNGLNVLDADGTVKFLRLPVVFSPQITGAVTSFHAIVLDALPVVGQDWFTDGISSVTEKGITVTSTGAVTAMGGVTLSSASGVLSAGNAYLITVIYDGVNSIIRVNGTQVASGDTGADAYEGIFIGARRSEIENPDHAFCEHVKASGALSGSVLTNQENALMSKWGI
jgi:hypothetical protein